MLLTYRTSYLSLFSFHVFQLHKKTWLLSNLCARSECMPLKDHSEERPLEV